LDTAPDVQNQLPAQEVILGSQGLGRPKVPIGRSPAVTGRPSGMECLRTTALQLQIGLAWKLSFALAAE
jgi:hypothetical protein